VVILLDVSGSMKGLRIEIARATVAKILDTLTDDDFFNVILVRHLAALIYIHVRCGNEPVNDRFVFVIQLHHTAGEL
jgi:uncharacterized protein YegL